MDSLFSSPHYRHPSSLSFFTDRQKVKIKSHLVDSNKRAYGTFPSFSPLHLELSPGVRIIDTFSDHFSFNHSGKNDNQCFQQLDSMVIESSLLQSTAIVTIDTSIKNDIATSISHMHISNQPLTKTIHHTAFVTSVEAELFAIRYGINQASAKESISKIIVVTDSIHVTNKIFNPTSHSLQIHVVAIFKELCHFFFRNSNNMIEFWESPNRLNWHLHKAVGCELKSSNPMPVYLCKTLWNFSRKSECNDISSFRWQGKPFP